jgi:hypothetical protein
VKIIKHFKQTWNITLLVVLDGLMPKFVSDRQLNVLQKSLKIWDMLQQTQEQGSNENLFMQLLDTYGARCFLNEVVNACVETQTEYFIAPYHSTPQLVHFFREKMVHCVAGSLMTLLYESEDHINQVIVDFDLEGAYFSFVDREDLMTVFSPNKQHK